MWFASVIHFPLPGHHWKLLSWTDLVVGRDMWGAVICLLGFLYVMLVFCSPLETSAAGSSTCAVRSLKLKLGFVFVFVLQNQLAEKWVPRHLREMELPLIPSAWPSVATSTSGQGPHAWEANMAWDTHGKREEGLFFKRLFWGGDWNIILNMVRHCAFVPKPLDGIVSFSSSFLLHKWCAHCRKIRKFRETNQ